MDPIGIRRQSHQLVVSVRSVVNVVGHDEGGHTVPADGKTITGPDLCLILA